MPIDKQAVLDAVRSHLEKSPRASTDELIAAAVAVQPSLAGIGRRAFNAGFVLPFKRKMGAGRGGKKRTARKAAKKTAKRGPGRPRKTAAKKVAKRGPGRPRKTVAKKVAKRGPGRPRKTVAKKASAPVAGKPKRRVGRPRGPVISPAAREAMRRLILERDQLVLDTLRQRSDPFKAYELAANLDAYVERLAAALKR